MSGPQVRHGTQMKIYQQHVLNLKESKAKTDNKAPRLPISTYIKDASFYGDIFRLRNVEKENRNLLRIINIIYRTKGRVDCQFEKYVRSRTMYIKNQDVLERQRQKIENFLKKLDLKFVKSEYNKQDMLKHWEKALRVMKSSSKYPEFYDQKHDQSQLWSLCPNGVISNPGQHDICFFDLKIGNLPKTLRVEIELYSDIVPGTACNFYNLCKGHMNPALTYNGSIFHRIVPGLLCIGGDIVNLSGTGGMSVYGATFPDENFTLQFNGPGVLAMYTTGPDQNNSQFIITFRKLSSLNGKYVVVGRIKSSLKTLKLIESCGTKSGKPLDVVRIVSCGVITSGLCNLCTVTNSNN